MSEKEAFEQKVFAQIGRFSMLRPGDTVAAAVSGGADSVALLAALLALSERLDVRVTAVHVNHGLRGQEADRDEAFVRALCRRMGGEASARLSGEELVIEVRLKLMPGARQPLPRP